jgi:peptidoglycan hydrolase-like protein with peptidoglycan-binding domain
MKKYLISSFFVLAASLPFTSSAATFTGCPAISHSLSQGMRDAQTAGDVTVLQTFLQKKGYLNSAPTGYFGALTAKAVQKFQSDNSLPTSGYFGTLSRQKFAAAGCTSSQSSSVDTGVSSSIATSSSQTQTTTYQFIPSPVFQPLSTVVISSISNSSMANDGKSVITLSGSGFASTSMIYLGGLNGTKIQPTGVSADGSSLTFVVPNTVGPFQYSLSVSNNGTVLSNALYISVTVPAFSKYTISTTSVPPARVGQNYYVSIYAAGFTNNFTWTIPTGSLPPGVSFDSGSNGYLPPLTLSGIPQTAGTYTFTVQATDSSGNIASLPVTIVVAPDTSTSLVPTIYALSTATGATTTQVIITGSRFDGKNYVLFNGRVAAGPIPSTDGKTVSFSVPDRTTSACNLFTTGGACSNNVLILTPAVYALSVENINGTSNIFNFTFTSN